MTPEASADSIQLRRIVWPFAIAETILWASFYYLFPALLPEWERSLGWSRTELSFALTGALVTAAFLAPVMGSWIDRGHARVVFIGSALLGAVMLAALSQVTQYWQFFAVWTGLGVAMAGALYEACFAILTRYLQDAAKRAIILVTLVAGLAGTVAFPVADTFVDLIGWRGTVLIFAAAVVLIAVPLLWLGCRQLKDPQGETVVDEIDRKARIREVLRKPVFWLLAIAFTGIAIEHGGLITHLLLILDDRGVGNEAAVLAAAMIGPMQVTGRLAMMAAERYVPFTAIAMACFLGMSGAAVCLLYGGGSVGLIAVFVIVHGAAYGLTSIARPVITAEFLGRKGFGVVSGMIATPYMFGFAAAPALTSLVWEAGGYDLVIRLAVGILLLGFVCFLAAKHLSGSKAG